MVATEKVKTAMTRSQLREVWPELTLEEQIKKFKKLSVLDAAHFFADLEARDQARIILTLPIKERRLWLRALDPDDAADVIQETEEEEQEALLNMLDQSTRNEVIALLTYAQDVAGGLMNPRYIQVRPEMRVDEAISYIRRRAREQEQVETIHYIYVLDKEQHLLGIVSMRELFQSSAQQQVKDVMHAQIITVAENLDQEEISVLFGKYALLALPVVDKEGRMKGVVTLDDIVDVVQQEATEDIQKMGGTFALDAPYLQITVGQMVKKRVGWLTVLFIGEMLTASTMQFFEKEIAKAVVLALFLPLIISSGGNAGSQACTLVIRAISLGEVRIRDCLRVLRRECVVGFLLGMVLALVGLMRVLFWPYASSVYGKYYVLIGLAVAVSIVGVVLWGALIGSFLPFILKKAGLDPATASAPFVATFVDVTGLIIYFSVASLILHGTLL
jgi:magnesium transporter